MPPKGGFILRSRQKEEAMLKLLTEFLWCFHNYWFCFKAALGESWVRQKDGKPEGSDWPRSRGTPVAELKGSTLIT